MCFILEHVLEQVTLIWSNTKLFGDTYDLVVRTVFFV